MRLVRGWLATDLCDRSYAIGVIDHSVTLLYVRVRVDLPLPIVDKQLGRDAPQACGTVGTSVCVAEHGCRNREDHHYLNHLRCFLLFSTPQLLESSLEIATSVCLPAKRYRRLDAYHYPTPTRISDSDSTSLCADCFTSRNTSVVVSQHVCLQQGLVHGVQRCLHLHFSEPLDILLPVLTTLRNATNAANDRSAKELGDSSPFS